MERQKAARVTVCAAVLVAASAASVIGVRASAGVYVAGAVPSPPPPSLVEQTTGDSYCSYGGEREVIDAELRCACRAGYSGETCESCAAGFERDRSGSCILGATARREMCFNKGTPYLNKFGDIACKCDAAYPGPDCGGPTIAIEGTLQSVEAGARRKLRATGGSGLYEWTLPSGRGVLLADGSANGRTYVAPTDVQQVEIVSVRIRDLAQPHVQDAKITVTPKNALTVTGIPVGDLVSFDQAMLDYMKGRGIRAGVLAVAKDGQLVLSRGYGYMDKGSDADPFVHDEGGVGLVGPSTPMRIASITKPITAAAVRMGLVGEDLTTLAALPFIDASLGEAITSLAEQWFPYTPDAEPYYVEQDVNNPYDNCLEWQEGSMPDSRWFNITIEDLLRHEGGFDRDLSPSPRWSGEFAPPPALSDTSYGATFQDPNFKGPLMIHDLANATGLDFTGPINPKQLVQYMAGLCLAFTPGSRMAYSNFGYTLLGRVLEGIHGQAWEPGDGTNRRIGWGPYIDIIEDFLAGYGIIGDIRAGGTGSYSSDNFDWVGNDEPYYRHLRDDGTEYSYLNVGDVFGVAPNGDMFFATPQGVPGPYGAFSMQTMESHGGLVATAPALIRFMRHFRLRDPSNYGTIGTPRPGTNIGGTSHSGLLPGTYGLAWQMSSGNQTFTVPMLLAAWDQTSDLTFSISSNTNCTLPTGIDVVALFNQSADPKDGDASEYAKLSQFLGRAACQVSNWPNPVSPTSAKAGQ